MGRLFLRRVYDFDALARRVLTRHAIAGCAPRHAASSRAGGECAGAIVLIESAATAGRKKRPDEQEGSRNTTG